MISDVYGFIRSHGQYSVLLHELAHGYDDRQLKRQDPGILKAFKAARTQGRYGAEAASPAVVDVREYFAVLTEAYFASRPETPHNRIELKIVDPQGYAAVEHAWGLR
ncbi:hypothetical protein BOO71_0010540 [Deinococcus marmoris]|uniref:Uncharacterized protein n=1 Tax=Deinococcus marmoris TaxID=249408 RepID=A0A1U7NVE5_9DEIO|nr:hypothetical protein BOO71_0010540 [Deinococcus marmoris]